MAEHSKIKWREFLSGDKGAYTWIYNNFVQILYSYGLRFTTDRELIKDCIHDIFTGLYRNRRGLPEPDNVKVYLLVSLKNALIRAIYKESRYERDAELVQFAIEPTVEEQFILKEEYDEGQKKLQQILCVLTPRQREIIYYRYIQELSFDEICTLMDMNYQSAQNLIQRSLLKIKSSTRVF